MNPLTHDSSKTLPVECFSCGSTNVSSTTEVEHFQYGDKEDVAMLSASVRVHHCASCDFSFTTEDAAESRHESVCRHLGVLTPKEVREIRDVYQLSQEEFSKLSKIGKASLARWEGGLLIQNQANDNLLYLLTFDDNVARLKERAYLRNTKITFSPKYRSLKGDDLARSQREAEWFNLYPAAECVG